MARFVNIAPKYGAINRYRAKNLVTLSKFRVEFSEPTVSPFFLGVGSYVVILSPEGQVLLFLTRLNAAISIDLYNY